MTMLVESIKDTGVNQPGIVRKRIIGGYEIIEGHRRHYQESLERLEGGTENWLIIFRSKNGYTVVQNTISRDRTISMKAKGLYLIIQSYITMPDKKWLKSDFMRMVPEGEKSFNSA